MSGATTHSPQGGLHSNRRKSGRNFSTSTCIKFTFFIQRKHHRRLLEQDPNIFFAKIPQGVLIPSYFFLSSLFPEFRSISSYVGEMHSGKAFFSRAGPWGRILCIRAILHLYPLIPWSYALAGRFFGGVICIYCWEYTAWDMGYGIGKQPL